MASRKIDFTLNAKVQGQQSLNQFANQLNDIEQTKQRFNRNPLRLMSNGITNTMNTLRTSMQATDTSSKSLRESFRGVSQELQGIASGIYIFQAVGGAVKDVVQGMDELVMTQSRMRLMNDGLMTTDQLTNQIYQSSQRSRGSFEATADMVAKLGLLAGDAFKDNQEIVDFAEQLNKQMKIAGTDTIQAKSAMLQLTQALGSGRLQGDELRSIMETMPTIIQSIADELDVPKGKVKELASDGKISAEVLKNAVLNSADEINAKFESIPLTFGDLMTKVKNEVQNKMTGVSHIFANIMGSSTMQQMLGVLSGTISNVMSLLGGLGMGLWTVFSTVFNIFYQIFSFIQPFADSVLGFLNQATGESNSFAMMLQKIGLVLGIVLGLFIMLKVVTAIWGVVTAVASAIATGGLALIPIVLILIITLVPVLIAYFFGMGSSVAEVCAGIAGGFAVMGSWIAFVVQTFIATIVNQFVFFANIVINIINIIGRGWTEFVNAWNRIMAIATSNNLTFFQKLGMVGREIAAGLLMAYGKMADYIGDIFNKVLNGVIDLVNEGLGMINKLIKGVNKITKLKIPTIGDIGKTSVGKSWGNSAMAKANELRSQNDALMKKAGIDIPEAKQWKDIDRFHYMKVDMPNSEKIYNAKYNEVLDYFKKPKEQPGLKREPQIPMDDGSKKKGTGGGLGKTPSIKAPTTPKTPSLNNPINKIANDTGAIKQSVATSEQDLKYLLDVAKRDVVNRYSATNIQIDMTNNNNISNDQDIDGIVGKLGDKLREELKTSAEGVHY